jgi:hypothetical protein
MSWISSHEVRKFVHVSYVLGIAWKHSLECCSAPRTTGVEIVDKLLQSLAVDLAWSSVGLVPHEIRQPVAKFLGWRQHERQWFKGVFLRPQLLGLRKRVASAETKAKCTAGVRVAVDSLSVLNGMKVLS